MYFGGQDAVIDAAGPNATAIRFSGNHCWETDAVIAEACRALANVRLLVEQRFDTMVWNQHCLQHQGEIQAPDLSITLAVFVVQLRPTTSTGASDMFHINLLQKKERSTLLGISRCDLNALRLACNSPHTTQYPLLCFIYCYTNSCSV